MGKRLAIQISSNSDVTEIRAHHLLCMRGFQGYGYSREFERNLEEVIHYLDLHPQSGLKVVASTDLICRMCPHLKDGRCDKSPPSDIHGMDLKVLEKLDVPEGAEKTVHELFKMVDTLNLHDLQDICGDCSWMDKCLFYQSKIKINF